MIFFLWIFNFAISCWNLYVTGKSWAETKAVGGWRRAMAWAGAVMACTGFTWCYLLVAAFALLETHKITAHQFDQSIEFGWLVLIPGLILSGFMISLDSWRTAFREGGFVNYGVAVYNTYAQIHNTMSVVSNLGSVLKDLKFGDSSDSDDNGGLGWIPVLVVGIALFGGIATTVIGIKLLSASSPLPEPPAEWRREIARRRL